MKTPLFVVILFCLLQTVQVYGADCDCYFVEGYFGGAGDTVSNFYLYRDGHHTPFLTEGKMDTIRQITLHDTLTSDVYAYLQKATMVKQFRVCNWRHADYSRVYSLLARFLTLERFEVCDRFFGNVQLAQIASLPLRTISIETEQSLLFNNTWKFPENLTHAYILTSQRLQFSKEFSRRAGIVNIVIGYDAAKGFPHGLDKMKHLQEVAFVGIATMNADAALRELLPIASQLKSLDFSNCGVEIIPSSIVKYTSLERFYLIGSPLRHGAGILNSLPKLRDVYLFFWQYSTDEKKQIRQELSAIKNVGFDD
ncbi:MAG: hypothetical protein IPM69_07205 [Ignavibacteria bacterium]|nr:hypothetical protein [Ignavibacteria bacterium]